MKVIESCKITIKNYNSIGVPDAEDKVIFSEDNEMVDVFVNSIGYKKFSEITGYDYSYISF